MRPPISVTIIQDEMTKQNIKHGQLAGHLGCSASYVGMLIRGNLEVTPFLALKIAEHLGCEYGDLFETVTETIHSSKVKRNGKEE